jgi:signal transduction histidine kinase
VTDANGRITYLNDAACAIFGLEGENAIGKPLEEQVRGLDWKALSQSDSALTRDMEIFYPTNRFINFYVVPLIIERRAASDSPDEHLISEAVGHAMILRDITESRRSAEQTIESERFSALTLLAAGVAHEIGNPLNSLHIHLQLMERKVRKLSATEEKRELQESIDIARAEINRLDSIVTQFLRAIRPSKPQLQPEDVNKLLEETIRFFQAEIKDRDIVVETELREDLPPLQLDRDQMKQVFYNAIKNSFEAMKRRGILRIRTDRDDTHVKISFTDTGGGISPENLSRVFEPYFTTKSGGSGRLLLIVTRSLGEHFG